MTMKNEEREQIKPQSLLRQLGPPSSPPRALVSWMAAGRVHWLFFVAVEGLSGSPLESRPRVRHWGEGLEHTGT